jgi:hypothetical protein
LKVEDKEEEVWAAALHGRTHSHLMEKSGAIKASRNLNKSTALMRPGSPFYLSLQ